MSKLARFVLKLVAVVIACSILIVGCAIAVTAIQVANMTPEERAARAERLEQQATARVEKRSANADRRAAEQVEREQREQADRDTGQNEPRQSEWELRTPENGVAPVAVSRVALNQLTEYAVAGDTYGITEMQLQGLVFNVPSGTKVIRLDGILICKVRLLDGAQANRVVWVAGDFLKRR